jgi:hypothetical protein
MIPRWASKPRRTDRLVVDRNVTLTLTTKTLHSKSQSMFMPFLRFSQYRAIVSLNSINRLVFVVKMYMFPARYELDFCPTCFDLAK